MKQSINCNILWTELFVTALESLGVKHACISPGSRNTPLIVAFQRSSKIKSYIHVDERSSGFFALGLANKTNKPVVVITTSGTAVAELYPAIIEAYQQKIPLIICTADRPPELLNTGANQTINQIDIFHNHIYKFYSLELPNTNSEALNKLLDISKKAFLEATKYKAPVHINFPFDKPFEPSKTTDKVNIDFLTRVREKFKNATCSEITIKINRNDISFVLKKVMESKKTLILVGPLNIGNKNLQPLFQLAKKINAPILADGLSGFRFTKIISKNLIINHASFLRSRELRENLDPDLIIQIGAAPTSNSVLEFYENSKAFKIIVNEYGELKDPSRTTDKIITAEFSQLFEGLYKQIDKNFIFQSDKKWTLKYLEVDKQSEFIKQVNLKKYSFPFEGIIINEIISLAPESANIMISNSLAVRDVDAFASLSNKGINVFSNRGASGIDGITSTAAGIKVDDKNPTFLLTGDLAFYYDITGLLSLKKYSIPLIIILLNNSGGGIFELLPIVKEKIDFQNYFKTPLNIDFKNIVTGFGGNYSIAKNWGDFSTEMRQASKRKTFSVLEIKIDSKKTVQMRKNIWNEIITAANLLLDEN